ncbi:MAG: hypothetical protein ABFS34_05565 [Gemmatimonadota bacterium]
MIAKTGLLAITMISLASAPAAAVAAPPRVDNDRAEELYDRAVSLLDSQHRWAEAASLLRRSAENRSQDDPAAFETMRFAGRVYAQAGDFGKSRETLTDAGDLALARGALVDAAHAYIEAAHAAIEQGDATRARSLAERAQRLSTSPLLPDTESASIASLVGAL